MKEPAWLDEQRASELGERYRALMNDSDEPVADPVGWEEAGVKLGAMLIDAQRESIDPVFRTVLVCQIGAYVGELLRRECGGKWIRDKGGPCVEFANGMRALPLLLVHRHFAEGSAGDIYGQYKVSRALGSLSSEELEALARGEFDLGQRFPELAGKVTLRQR